MKDLVFTLTRSTQVGKASSGEKCASTPIIFHQSEGAKPGCSQWTCSGRNHQEALPKRQWVLLLHLLPWAKRHPPRKDGGETEKRVPDPQRHSVKIQTSPGALA